jgi:ribose transport system permease protein
MNKAVIRLRGSMKPAGLPAFIIILYLLFVWIQPAMASLDSLENLVKQTSLLFLIASAQLMVLIARGFDLSVGANVSVVSVVSCMVMVGLANHNLALALAAGLLAAIAIGLLIGAVNGVIVAYLDINPFVVTLGTMSIVGGIATTASGGFPIFDVPAAFSRIFNQMNWLFLPAPITAALLIAILLHLILTRTAYGRTLYLIGDNLRAAEVAGRDVRLHLFSAYVTCGILAAFAGLMMTAQTGSGEPNLGSSLVLNSIAAAVVGGASLRGGTGGIMAPLQGAALVTVVSVGMNLARVDGSLQPVVIGLVVIGATLFGLAQDRRK